MRIVAAALTLLIVPADLQMESGRSGQRFPGSAYLDEAGISRAVQWSRTGAPQPYLLLPRHGRREPSMAVYTPAVRVALAVRVARQRGRDVNPGDLPAWITAPTVHVVVRPPRPAGLPSLREVPITQIGVSHRSDPIFLDYIRPLALVRDLSYLDAIGGRPFPDAVAAALFEPEPIAGGRAIYGWWQMGNTYYPVDGVLEPEHVKSWR